jgi:hypothetical protein
MNDKIRNLDEARRKKRAKTGWTIKVIKERGKRFLEKHKEAAQREPADLVSGDMDKFLRGEDDDEHD